MWYNQNSCFLLPVPGKGHFFKSLKGRCFKGLLSVFAMRIGLPRADYLPWSLVKLHQTSERYIPL